MAAKFPEDEDTDYLETTRYLYKSTASKCVQHGRFEYDKIVNTFGFVVFCILLYKHFKN